MKEKNDWEFHCDKRENNEICNVYHIAAKSSASTWALAAAVE